MRISARVIGADRLKGYLNSLTDHARVPVVRELERSAIAIHTEAVKSIQEHRSSGIRYGKHVASKPGFPPNSDTGVGAGSIMWNVDVGLLQAAVGTNLDYMAGFEHGTSRAKARPWLGPAYRKLKRAVVENMRRALAEAFRRK